MRLHYKLGYFISAIVVVIGLMLKLSEIDNNQIIFYAGLLGLGISGIFYVLRDFYPETSQLKWMKLIGCIVVIILVAIHFVYDIKTYYLIFAGYFFMQAFDKKFAFEPQEKNE